MAAKKSKSAPAKLAKQTKAVIKDARKNISQAKQTIVSLKNSLSSFYPTLFAAPSKQPLPKKTARKKTTAKKTAPNKPDSKTSLIEPGRPYTLRSLPFAKGKSYTAIVNSLEANQEKLDKDLKRGEYFAATVFGNRTKIVYSNITLLLDKLNEYVANAKKGDKASLIRELRVIKFAGSPGSYAKQRERVVAKREKRKSDVKKEAVSQVGGKKKEKNDVGRVVTKNKTSIDLLDDVLKQLKKLKAENAKLKREAKKTASNKTAPKKIAPKKTTPKKGSKRK